MGNLKSRIETLEADAMTAPPRGVEENCKRLFDILEREFGRNWGHEHDGPFFCMTARLETGSATPDDERIIAEFATLWVAEPGISCRGYIVALGHVLSEI
jgi:hypothetical protein